MPEKNLLLLMCLSLLSIGILRWPIPVVQKRMKALLSIKNDVSLRGISMRWLNYILKNRARLCLVDANADLLPAPLLRKYIAYAREYVHPVLGEEAKKEIKDFYLHLRMSQYSNDSTPITPRQLESLVRLAQVRTAKCNIYYINIF